MKEYKVIVDGNYQAWWLNGKLHREDGPALIDDRQAWYLNGKLHREDDPAYINGGDVREWWLNGKRHRENGPAIINGDIQRWYLNGELHREDGPAIIDGSLQVWYLNGERHREDGPALIKGNHQEWYLNGEKLSEQEFNKRTNKVKEMTMEEQCDCCFGKGVIEEWDGDEGSCMNCNGSGKLKYSPFIKLIEFGDEKIKKEIDDYYFIDKSRLMNIENVMMKLREENKKLKKELEECKFNETFNKEGNSNE